MGRKRKTLGTLYEDTDGKRVRLNITRAKFPPFIGKLPRGKTGAAYQFTTCLREFAPFVYAYVLDELKRPEPGRHISFQKVSKEWQRASGSTRRPSARALASFAVERALDGAWQVWGIKPPFSGSEEDSFWRRYVLGHPKALPDYRRILREPKPWPPEHRGHWLKFFFGTRGEAAREFNFLKLQQPEWTIISMLDEP
jgi:hypothetical protein